MSFSKKTREAVYAKYDGHCAYCGREISYKDRVNVRNDECKEV